MEHPGDWPYSVSKPASGQTDTVWPKALTINHIVIWHVSRHWKWKDTLRVQHFKDLEIIFQGQTFFWYVQGLNTQAHWINCLLHSDYPMPAKLTFHCIPHLLTMNFFSLCEKSSTLPLFLIDIFTGYRIVGWQYFLLCTLNSHPFVLQSF